MKIMGVGVFDSCTRWIVSSACLATWLGSMAVAQSQLIWDLEGRVAGSSFGTSVAGVGDVNRDGISDLLVGAPQAGIGGEAYLLDGASSAVLHTFAGANVGDDFGYAVARAGDVDRDGTPDVIVGAPRAGGAGQATLFSGATGAMIHAPLAGTTPGEEFGKSVSCAGDVDQDGFEDVLVGSPSASVGGWSRSGRATLFSGATGTVIHTLTLSGPNFMLGWSVASGGDIDNDGVSDLLAGAPTYMLPATNAGLVVVFSGATGSALFSIRGWSVGDLFGCAVAGLGDIDADGYDDFVVGARWGGTQNHGYALVVSGRTHNYILGRYGTNPFDTMGTCVAGPGDVDGDGTPDVAWGAPQPNGMSTGYFEVVSGRTGSRISIIYGTTNDEWCGNSLALAGDVDGDGFNDIVAGSPKADPGGLVDAGAARVYSVVGPPGSKVFGLGCSGSAGHTPAITTRGGAPSSGGNPNFSIVINHALGGAPVLLFTGISSQSWNGIPLPLDLGILGLQGCALLVSNELMSTTTATGPGSGLGTATIPMPIPTAPYLYSRRVYFQGFVLDPGGGRSFPGAMSRGLDLVFVR